MPLEDPVSVLMRCRGLGNLRIWVKRRENIRGRITEVTDYAGVCLSAQPLNRSGFQDLC